MNATTLTSPEVIEKLADFLWSNKGKCMPWADTREKLWRYTAFCFLNGKLAFSFDGGEVETVIFYQTEHIEQLEMKVAENRSIFEWKPCHPGDCLVFLEVVGNRHGVSKLWHSMLVKWPHLLNTPVLTMRHGKLHNINREIQERFAR